MNRQTGIWSALRRTKTTALPGCVLGICCISVLAACLFGPLPITATEVLQVIGVRSGLLDTPAILHQAQAADAAAHLSSADRFTTLSVVVWDIRLSRILLAWLVGCALALAGTVFQGILRNPLADPFTLGVSGGAAFGASLAIQLGLAGSLPLLPGVGVIPACGLAGAILALFTVIALGRSGGTLRRETLVLAGVVVSAFLSALISLVKALDEDSVASIVFWIMGSLQGRTWEHVALFLPWAILGTAIIWRFSRELDILSLGETQAQQLGMNASRIRLFLLIGASLLTGAAVSVSGIIGFVGLIIPHLVRLLQGGEHRPLLLTSGLMGGLLLLWSDVAARSMLPNGLELPVGVLTALLGGPFFCLLLRSHMKGRI